METWLAIFYDEIYFPEDDPLLLDRLHDIFFSFRNYSAYLHGIEWFIRHPNYRPNF